MVEFARPTQDGSEPAKPHFDSEELLIAQAQYQIARQGNPVEELCSAFGRWIEHSTGGFSRSFREWCKAREGEEAPVSEEALDWLQAHPRLQNPSVETPDELAPYARVWRAANGPN